MLQTLESEIYGNLISLWGLAVILVLMLLGVSLLAKALLLSRLRHHQAKSCIGARCCAM